MRRVGSTTLGVVFLLAFFRAPFDHIHSHGPQDHEHAGYVHGHLPHALSSSGAEVHGADPDDDAQSLDWFHAVSSHSPAIIAVLTPIAVVTTVHASEPLAELTESCGHDPPDFTKSSPRSPPA